MQNDPHRISMTKGSYGMTESFCDFVDFVILLICMSPVALNQVNDSWQWSQTDWTNVALCDNLVKPHSHKNSQGEWRGVGETGKAEDDSSFFFCGCLFGLVFVFKFSFLGDAARVKEGYGGGERVELQYMVWDSQRINKDTVLKKINHANSTNKYLLSSQYYPNNIIFKSQRLRYGNSRYFKASQLVWSLEKLSRGNRKGKAGRLCYLSRVTGCMPEKI